MIVTKAALPRRTFLRGAGAAGAASLVGTWAATSVSVIATASVVTAFSTTEMTRQRFRRLRGRVSMISTLSMSICRSGTSAIQASYSTSTVS